MNQSVTVQTIRSENIHYSGTGGISQENRSQGFKPGFIDIETGVMDISRFSSGQPAPVHLLEGVPQDWVVRRSVEGRVKAVKKSVLSGFIRNGCFFTRDETATLMAESGKARPGPRELGEEKPCYRGQFQMSV